ARCEGSTGTLHPDAAGTAFRMHRRRRGKTVAARRAALPVLACIFYLFLDVPVAIGAGSSLARAATNGARFGNKLHSPPRISCAGSALHKTQRTDLQRWLRLRPK